MEACDVIHAVHDSFFDHDFGAAVFFLIRLKDQANGAGKIPVRGEVNGRTQ